MRKVNASADFQLWPLDVWKEWGCEIERWNSAGLTLGTRGLGIKLGPLYLEFIAYTDDREEL